MDKHSHLSYIGNLPLIGSIYFKFALSTIFLKGCRFLLSFRIISRAFLVSFVKTFFKMF